MTSALLIVDVQEDFVEGGSLAVTGGRAVARGISEYLTEGNGFNRHDLIVASRDWHAAWPNTNGGHFVELPNYVDSWPIHCVAGEDGAEYAAELALPDTTVHIYKGMGRPDYSAFQGKTESGEELITSLSNAHVDDLTIVGIATDHCVRASALDALYARGRYGYPRKVTVRIDLCAGVDRERSRQALKEIVAAGGQLDWDDGWAEMRG